MYFFIDTVVNLEINKNSLDDIEQKLKRSCALVLLLKKENQQLKDKASNFKQGEVLQGY